ncbi:unnamed protein product [marine sediment metagenome]|uniref:Uncharacterized protein n=1 Tax=marine sediment metagenome TaxID=412755 RepID=X1QZ05_9ZZZZ
MFIVERAAYPQEGVGKPDFSRAVSSALERRGITIGYNQTLKIFGLVFTAVNTGTHTAPPHATIMTDATAHFIAVNALIGLTIVNVTDGSSGVIIANTETTVTVAELTDGISNKWNTGDAYTIPSPFHGIVPPLAPEGILHVIDLSTGFPSPLDIPQGYAISLIAAGALVTEDVILWGYIDGYLATGIGVFSAGVTHYENKILGLTTETVDPAGDDPHTIDVTIQNLGLGTLQGGVELFGIIEPLSTKPLPTTKTVRCKSCGHEETVPNETARWICPGCGQLNIFYDLSRFRGTR